MKAATCSSTTTGSGERSSMTSIEVLAHLLEQADAEEIRKAYTEAIEAIKEKQVLENRLKRSVQVPCMVGDKLYSIIGEHINCYVIDGYRIEKNDIYMTSDEIFFPASKIGKYYFLSEPVAKIAFDNMHKNGVNY